MQRMELQRLRRIGRTVVIALLWAGAARAQGSGRTTEIDPGWLISDAAARQVTFDVIAGYNGVNGALNFNGFADGELTVIVPLGWRVVMPFSNRDGVLPHSAQIIDDVRPIPPGPVESAFQRAYSTKLAQGLAAGQTDVIRFRANRAGKFMIFCAVPGHGLAGMWIGLDVVEGAEPAMKHRSKGESRP